MNTEGRVTLMDIIRLIEWPDNPCNYIVFRNQVLLEPRELDLYMDYEVEMLDTRLEGFIGEQEPTIIIYLI